MRFMISMLVLATVCVEVTGQQLDREQAPPFSLKTPGNQRVRLTAYKGKVVLLNFWATWCAPCRAEMPDLVKWQEEYRSAGLQIIGITLAPFNRQSVRELTKKLRINYPIVLDSGGLARRYGVGEVMPVTIVIDRQGTVVDRILGIIESEEFEERVNPLLK